MSPNANFAIEAVGLTKRFGEKTAVDGISFSVPTGTVTSLLGPNGSGKTTTVRMLTTLTDLDGGTAFVAGVDVAAAPQEVRRRIGLAAQDATVDKLLTARENLIMLGELYQLDRSVARERAAELLSAFSLEDAADRVVSGFSGGMRRRLDLAATLVSHPEVLFLDEPTTGLDPRARAELWEVLDTLVGRGTTLLLTTQYLEEAERLANDIIVLDHGKIIAQGDSRELKRQVGGDQIQVVVVDPQQIDLVSRIVSKVAETEPTIDLAGRAVIAPTTNGVDTLVRVATELRDSKIEVDDISMRQPTLDEVFLTLTGSDTGSESDDSIEQNKKGR